ncbi:hypothetical protein ABEX29_25625 [Brevibacillus porteri]|uniref:hypothetical protein n=1 Tax=Brevibacillus porteri TaxID=2126350 RepID=UPI003D234ED7
MEKWMQEMALNQTSFLLSCQLPSGTFRLSPKRDQINPYFTNLGIISLIRMKELEAVRGHLDWYLRNLNADGYINDFRLEQGREIDTGTNDSEDSYHTTYFSLLAEWIRATGRMDWLHANHAKLLSLLQAVARLQQKDGLTWAKHSYRVKYLMDNCEVAKGLADASYLFSLIGNVEAAEEAAARAKSCELGINGMYSRIRKSYAMYDRTYPGWRKWYPDVTSQAFPIVYSLTDANTASLLYQRITAAFPQFDTFQTGDLYPWMTMGVCAQLMGDKTRVKTMLVTATDLYIHGPRYPYWLIQDAGRYIELLLERQS